MLQALRIACQPCGVPRELMGNEEDGRRAPTKPRSRQYSSNRQRGLEVSFDKGSLRQLFPCRVDGPTAEGTAPRVSQRSARRTAKPMKELRGRARARCRFAIVSPASMGDKEALKEPASARRASVRDEDVRS